MAQMKGVILSINPDVRLVDLSHAVSAQNIRQAALLLEDVTPLFPPETIHTVVVDPGVGTDRKLVYAKFGDQHFVAPDNGCLSRLALREPSPYNSGALRPPDLARRGQLDLSWPGL